MTALHYDLPQRSHVRLVIYDLHGRKVSTLADARVGPGYRRVTWNGRNEAGRKLPTGIYIARMVTPAYTKSIKMVLLK
ncbi:MAG: hypothetical protein IH971_10495 [Candidatus Marinimicrobia bacterium]|nr:hypothetical protein [Candidatus Neomarinimicrobiota bacterium]